MRLLASSVKTKNLRRRTAEGIRADLPRRPSAPERRTSLDRYITHRRGHPQEDFGAGGGFLGDFSLTPAPPLTAA
jgi:hypothetical protein